jgi:NADP-dependent 3-hydroxy acid dehydrogenase YdfG
MSTKVVIITGASSGMGAATAKLLAQKGHKVMMAARREERLQELCKEIVSAGGEASFKVTDVASRAGMEALAAETIRVYGKIDAIVNNAGVMPLSFFRNLKIDE